MRAGGDWKIKEGDVTFGEVIGEGGKSTVYEGTLNRNSKSIPLALKRYRIARMSACCRRQIESEAEYLSRFNHQNVIKYFGTCLEKKVIIMEKMGLVLTTSGSDSQCRVNNVREYLDELAEEDIDSKIRIKITLDAARSLEHLHCNGIVHRDLKSSNLLVKEDPNGHGMITKVRTVYFLFFFLSNISREGDREEDYI